MPTFRCKKGMWEKAVNALSENDVGNVFKCQDCSLFPKQCDGYGTAVRKKLPEEDKVRLALTDLAKSSPKYVRVSKAREIFQLYEKEIKAAYAKGHSCKKIAVTLQSFDLPISFSTIYRQLRIEAKK